jgi:hypothetical protein
VGLFATAMRHSQAPVRSERLGREERAGAAQRVCRRTPAYSAIAVVDARCSTASESRPRRAPPRTPGEALARVEEQQSRPRSGSSSDATGGIHRRRLLLEGSNALARRRASVWPEQLPNASFVRAIGRCEKESEPRGRRRDCFWQRPPSVTDPDPAAAGPIGDNAKLPRRPRDGQNSSGSVLISRRRLTGGPLRVVRAAALLQPHVEIPEAAVARRGDRGTTTSVRHPPSRSLLWRLRR